MMIMMIMIIMMFMMFMMMMPGICTNFCNIGDVGAAASIVKA